MGSLFASTKKVSVPPSVPSTVIDEVNGVEQVPQTNADGSITYITRKRPLTAEQQAKQDQLDAIMKDSLAQIQALSATDYAPDAETQKVLAQWQDVQKTLLNDQYRNRSMQEETALAQRGLGDSSAAQEVRRQRALDEQKSVQTLALAKDQMASDVRDQKLQLQQNLYSLASSASDVSAAQTAAAAARAQSQAAAYNTQRQASLLNSYMSQNGGGYSVFGNAFSSSLGGNLGKVVTTASGNIGSLLGSWLF